MRGTRMGMHTLIKSKGEKSAHHVAEIWPHKPHVPKGNGRMMTWTTKASHNLYIDPLGLESGTKFVMIITNIMYWSKT